MKKFTLYLSTVIMLGSQAFMANAQEAYDLPYVNHIETQEDFDEFIIFDESNDGNTWLFVDDLDDGSAAQYRYSIMTPANDYLITPLFKVEAGEEYELMFDYYHSNYMNCYENLEVKFGYERTVEGLTQQIIDMPNLDPNYGALWRPKHVRFKATESGNGCIGFRVYSEPDQNVLRLRNIVVRHVSDTDMRVISFFGTDVAYVDEPIMHRIEVTNTGKSTVTGARAQVRSSLDDTVLGETVIKEIAANETQIITVQWTPTTQRTIDIYAYIDLEGDTYQDDNTSTRILDVDVRQVEGDRLYSIGYPDEDGYRPIFTYYMYSTMETIYYAKDFIFKEMDITGMQYVHIPPEDVDPRMSAVPVQVYMMNTDLNEMTGFLPAEDYTLVFDGTIDASGTMPLNLVDMKFQTPFQYKGGNVAVKVVSDRNYYLPLVEWLIVNETDLNLPIRSYFNACDDKSWVLEGLMEPAMNTHIPFLRFFYKNGDTGVMTVGNNASELTVNKFGDNLLFNTTCDEVRVYSVAGNLLLQATDVDTLSLASLQAGVYIVKGVANGEAVTLKIVK